MTNETTTQQASYSVPECNMSTLLERIEVLNKRCRRLGIPEIVVDVADDYIAHQYTDGDRRWWVKEADLETADAEARIHEWNRTGAVMPWRAVTITGAAPKYAGWKFIATLEPIATDDETVNLIMTVPGETCPAAYMRAEAVGRCDHCQVKRNRKQTFVVQHEDGTFKAVGRSCIKDFLGHTDPNRLAAWAELLGMLGGFGAGAEDEGWMGEGRTDHFGFDLEYYLGWVAAMIRKHGWMSRTRGHIENRPATVDDVNFLLDPPPFKNAEARVAWENEKTACTPTDEDKAEAAQAVAWAMGLDIDELSMGDNSYLANVAILARAGRVDRRTCGLGGSIIAAYARACDKAKKAAEVAARPDSKHIGKCGERAVYRVRVERVIPTEGMYGTTLVTKMLAWDEERGVFANDMVWFATGGTALDEDEEYLIKATVKQHSEYNGRPQTVVNRVAPC